MLTFTAIALDRLLEPGASKSTQGTKSSPLPDSRRLETPLNNDEYSNSSYPKHGSVPPHPSNKLRRRNTTSFSATPTAEKKTQWPQISPALYATPESTPLPDSPTSYPPSPYIINHKRRGPRLLNSSSAQNVSFQQKENSDCESLGNGHSSDTEKVVDDSSSRGIFEVEVGPDLVEDVKANGFHGGKSRDDGHGLAGNGVMWETSERLLVGELSVERDSEVEDFFDPQESMSFTSNTDAEDNYSSVERSGKSDTPGAEFFDAWEELSSDSGRQKQPSIFDIQTEVREMRTSLLMEIEKRKQAEEALNDMSKQWDMLREKMMNVGLILPVDLTTSLEDGQLDIDPSEDICRQVHVVRFVSESIGRGAAKAEVEEEMEAQLQAKNFEIARLCDRLHYYEAMNQEMSQRNQEAMEVARQDRQRQKRRQRWVWGSIAVAITFGSAALAWSYIPSDKASSSTDHLEAANPDIVVE